jgi:hypothetical protein
MERKPDNADYFDLYERRGAGLEVDCHNREAHETYAHQAGFTSRADAYHATELVLACMQAVGTELVIREDWQEGEHD